jgi:hypothetical protein
MQSAADHSPGMPPNHFEAVLVLQLLQGREIAGHKLT